MDGGLYARSLHEPADMEGLEVRGDPHVQLRE